MVRRSLLFGLLALFSCAPSEAPATRETIHLSGSAYDRGLQHGQQLRSKIHSFYTTLLTNSLLPYLSREQADIAGFLKEYSGERYQNGNFGYELLLDSAKSLERSLPKAAREELHGIADGSGLAYEKVLVLNTFVDTVLAVRGVAMAIRLSRSPLLEKVEFLGAEKDGRDNDADGAIDEAGEESFSPYEPSPGAIAVELPASVQLRLTLKDADGIDRSSVRLVLDQAVYDDKTPELTFESPSADVLVATLSPKEPLSAGATLTLVIGAGDGRLLKAPAPEHLSFMRDEELVFTTEGAGLAPAQVLRPTLWDGRTRPPPIAVALSGEATTDRAPLLAQHFALLDANTSHKHTAVFVHHPEGAPAFAVVGWAGITWGFSGLSARGVGYACNPADTLDNSVVGGVVDNLLDLDHAKLIAKGTPIGFVGRRILETADSVDSALEIISKTSHPYGWTCLMADGQGGLRGVEVDSDIFEEGSAGIYPFGPTTRDASDRLLASRRENDLFAASSFALNTEDISRIAVAGQRILPQRFWSGFFFRSQRARAELARQIDSRYGRWDVASAQALLAEPALVDSSDSMNAVVLEPASNRLSVAMGTEPATATAFETVDLTEVAP